MNGFASVLGGVLAIILGMAWGFTIVTLIAGGCYLAAFLLQGRVCGEEK